MKPKRDIAWSRMFNRHEKENKKCLKALQGRNPGARLCFIGANNNWRKQHGIPMVRKVPIERAYNKGIVESFIPYGDTILCVVNGSSEIMTSNELRAAIKTSSILEGGQQHD